jgi:CHASE2 domain-containing sensor protein
MIRRRTQQLLILGFIILIVAVGVNTSALKRIDLILYDTWLSLSTTKPPSEVVIVRKKQIGKKNKRGYKTEKKRM